MATDKEVRGLFDLAAGEPIDDKMRSIVDLVQGHPPGSTYVMKISVPGLKFPSLDVTLSPTTKTELAAFLAVRMAITEGTAVAAISRKTTSLEDL